MAEQNINPTTEQEPTAQEPTIEELMASVAELKAEAAKNKAALDKAMRERGEAVKALREKQTAQEIADEENRKAEEERNEYVKELETFKSTTLAEKRYLLQGMPAEMAEKAAKAEIAGDMDGLATIQKQFTEAALKAAKAEWQKSAPEVNRGVGGGAAMTHDEIFAIKDRKARLQAIQDNIQLFGEQ